MTYAETAAQIFGILGLIFSALSYQEKKNSRFFILQGMAGLMFFINFIMIGALSAALFNMVNLVRGVTLSKKGKKLIQVIVLESLYTACFVFSLFTIFGNFFQIVLSSVTFLSLVIMTYVMWKGNGKYIRYGQLFISSPAWIFHNIFNFSLGGILCEVFMMTSAVISFIRYGKEGFEK